MTENNTIDEEQTKRFLILSNEMSFQADGQLPITGPEGPIGVEFLTLAEDDTVACHGIIVNAPFTILDFESPVDPNEFFDTMMKIQEDLRKRREEADSPAPDQPAVGGYG